MVKTYMFDDEYNENTKSNLLAEISTYLKIEKYKKINGIKNILDFIGFSSEYLNSKYYYHIILEKADGTLEDLLKYENISLDLL